MARVGPLFLTALLAIGATPHPLADENRDASGVSPPTEIRAERVAWPGPISPRGDSLLP